MPIPALLAAAIPSLIEAGADLIRAAGKKKGGAMEAVANVVADAVDSGDRATVEDAMRNLTPADQVALEQLAADVEKARLALEGDLAKEDTARIETVNETMRAESVAEHWPQWAWRPFIGFAFGLYIISLFMLPLFRTQPVMLSPDITMAIGAVLGVSAWYRGRMQERHGRGPMRGK